MPAAPKAEARSGGARSAVNESIEFCSSHPQQQLVDEIIVPALSLFLIYWHRSPGFVRVESLHVPKRIGSLQPEIFLVDNAVVADDEGPYTGDFILRRRSHQSKATDHYSFHDKIQFAERGCRALTLENLEEVAVVRFAAAITLFDGPRDLVTYRPSPGAIGILPRQAI